ncbi:RimK family alpha-L-glutamate ligase [Actinoplanes sp. NPDC049599]|uniref:RimK family alpha-L-glutamate ligase n=1 Tax=Actinoplanes sp. NPDC049599 TaxID=3363903 RepID=UPI003790CD64
MRIALVTSRSFPEANWHDGDTPLVAEQLTARGATAAVVTWDGDESVDWAGYDAVVLQSPWSMWRQEARFAAWLRARQAEGTRLLNPADAVALGSDKRYLPRLGAAGVPIVPTLVVERPTAGELREAFPPAGSPRRTVVAKPVAAGGALGAREFTINELPQLVAYAAELGTAIIQPYVHAIDTHRELGVLTLDGRVSHAITKAAILRPGDATRAFHPDPQPYRSFTPRQEQVITRSYAALRGLLTREPLAVRLDFIIAPDSPAGLLLLEVEMVAPVKFFAHFPAECAAYAEAILARAGGVTPPRR